MILSEFGEHARALIRLIDSFAGRELSAPQFEARYMASFKGIPDLPDELYEILNEVFLDCDEYVEHPELRDDGDLDDAGLRERVLESRKRLEQLMSG